MVMNEENMTSKLKDCSPEELAKAATNDNELWLLLTHADTKIHFNELLEEYGTEVLYEIANELKRLADEDMNNAIAQCEKRNISDY